ncbi:MAG: DUF5706 domain-containing protein [Candidatus Marinimicrobia bacterium]|nr:DUF5706 domain-containing protein [Candidatus Neomarinimicrobiota bacterium]
MEENKSKPVNRQRSNSFHVDHPGGHLDHMMKQTRSHHVQLSVMADSKANMLLTVATVVITLSVPHLVNPQLRWGMLVIIFFSFLTIVLSTYAVMPKLPLTYKPNNRPDMKAPSFNLLFFGSFVRLNLDEYLEAMESVVNDPSQTYEVMIKEIYTLGDFLARKKYRFIRLAYLTFIFGVFSSVVTLLFTGGLLG